MGPGFDRVESRAKTLGTNQVSCHSESLNQLEDRAANGFCSKTPQWRSARQRSLAGLAKGLHPGLSCNEVSGSATLAAR